MMTDSRRGSRAGWLTAALALLALAGGASRAEAWGFTAHRMINRKAIETLPPPLRTLFEGNAAYLTEHVVDPDLWRAAGQAGEGPNHFLNMDAFGPYPFAAISHDEREHLAKNGPEAAKHGRVPWRVGEVYRDLVEAFRKGETARALELAAVLGHYVADAHVPFHAVVGYDGQATGQRGIHTRWESDLVDRFEQQLESAVPPPPAHRVEDPVGFVFDTLLESYREHLEALASDKASAGEHDYAATAEDDRYGHAYYSKMYEREGARLRSRLQSAVVDLGSLWLSAWDDAGRPTLDTAFRFPYVRRATRAVLVSLDGSSAPLIDDAVARGVMPNLARLRAAGATAKGSITSLPAKTAAGHAALFTGAWPERNGIVGNEVPAEGASVLESVAGFSSGPLRAEPIWAAAARQGLDVSVMSATQTYPFAPYLEEKRFGSNLGRALTLIDGYQTYEVSEALYSAKDLAQRPSAGWSGPLPGHLGETRDFDLSVAGTHIFGLLYDDPADPNQGFDTMYLSVRKEAKDGIALKPITFADEGTVSAGLTVGVPGGEVGVHFRLFALSPNGSEILLYRSEGGVIRSNKPLVEGTALKATGGFTGNGASNAYERGLLGPTLAEGGSGVAEKRYLETVRLVTRQFKRLFDFGFDRTRWDLLVAYLPYPDEFLHSWLGLLDPALSGHDPAVAAKLKPFLDQALAIVDDYVGQVMKRAGTDVILAVGSDHGEIGSNRTIRLNVLLEKAGLLTLSADGNIDLFRTSAVYFPGNAGYFLINRVSRREGIVKPADEEKVLARLRTALQNVKDPDTGKLVVTEIIDPRTAGAELGMHGPQAGDLYINLAPGYYPSASARGDVIAKSPPRGVHMLDPLRQEMWAAFVVAGPGVAKGADLGTIHQVDIAPTLAALLGLEPPAQATGAVLRKALARALPAAPAAATH